MGTILREKVSSPDTQEVEIIIEVDEANYPGDANYQDFGPIRSKKGDIPTQAFEKGMQLIRTCAEQVADSVRKVSEAARPSEIEVQLGVKFSGEVGALITKTGVDAHLLVKLKWVRKDAQ